MKRRQPKVVFRIYCMQYFFPSTYTSTGSYVSSNTAILAMYPGLINPRSLIPSILHGLTVAALMAVTSSILLCSMEYRNTRFNRLAEPEIVQFASLPTPSSQMKTSFPRVPTLPTGNPLISTESVTRISLSFPFILARMFAGTLLT